MAIALKTCWTNALFDREWLALTYAWLDELCTLYGQTSNKPLVITLAGEQNDAGPTSFVNAGQQNCQLNGNVAPRMTVSLSLQSNKALLIKDPLVVLTPTLPLCYVHLYIFFSFFWTRIELNRHLFSRNSIGIICP